MSTRPSAGRAPTTIAPQFVRRARPASRLQLSSDDLPKRVIKILHDGVPRTFRDRRETALEAAQFAKSRAKGDIIELRDCATGEKLVMMADGRVG